MSGGDNNVQFNGRILYLTEDVDLLRKQLRGELLSAEEGCSAKLIDNISTDEITPGWVCFYYDETLGEYSLVGLRGQVIERRSIKDGNFDVIVSGQSKGCGSSREQAPYSELAAGVKLVVAKSIEKIYGQNCQNIGLLTSTDFSLLPRIARGEAIEKAAFVAGLDPFSVQTVEAGGLFAFNRLRKAGKVSFPLPTPKKTADGSRRPMTMVEKIIAKHALTSADGTSVGMESVAPGDSVFVKTDVRFSHEYVTPMAEALFVQALGKDAAVTHPESVFTFRDHLTFLGEVMPEERKKAGLLDRANELAHTQSRFAGKHKIKLYGESERGGSEAICHNAVTEDIGLPGQVITGTDSHTCMAGALGAFAFGVGSTDMANAWYTQDVRVKVPESVRFVLKNKLKTGVSAKDVMLHILAQPFFRTSHGIGKVLEFCGEGLEHLPMDEQATLTNMAVEAGGFTGILSPSEVVIDYLHQMRGIAKEALRAMVVTSDDDAEYAASFEVDLATIPVMLATPGDPRNGVPIESFVADVPIQIAYGGSCTGGKKADMDMYAMVFRQALAQGKKVHADVQCFIQFGSQHIRSYAAAQGYLEIFQQVGANLVEPSCGACINAGPGASTRADQVTISAINRNFPGRSGPGQVYLASPLVIAASAVAGKIVSPSMYLA